MSYTCPRRPFDRLLPILTAVLFALVMSLLAPTAKAETLVARQGDDWVRLTEEPCSSPLITARLQPGMEKLFQSASAFFQGQHYQACWRIMGNAAYMIYEDGDQGVVPANELKPELNV